MTTAELRQAACLDPEAPLGGSLPGLNLSGAVSAAKLTSLDHALDEDVLLAGDSVEAKRQVASLVARIPGLRPVNPGRPETAKLIEGLTPLLIGLNSRYRRTPGSA